MAQVGHFGTPAIVAGILAVALLVLHLAVPFGVFVPTEEDRDFGIESETFSRGDIAENYSDFDGYGPASPGATLAGIIIALVAGVFLIVTGFVPMPVYLARYTGWLFGFLGAAGALITAASSAYWGGTFLTILFDTIIPGNPDNVGTAWYISPLIVMAGAIVMLVMFLRVMTNVVAIRDDLRDTVRRHIRGMKLAAVILLLTVSMPWALQVVAGEDRREAGLCDPSETCQTSVQLFTAHGHGQADGAGFATYGGIIGIADATKDAVEPLFGGLAFSIKVLTAMGWVGFLLGGLATIGHVTSSAFKAPAAARFSPAMLIGNLVMGLWGAIMFLLAHIYQWKPNWDKEATFAGLIKDQLWLPGFLSLAVGAFLVIWVLGQLGFVRDVFGQITPAKGDSEKQAVSFD